MSFTFPSNHISTEKMREALRAAAQVARASRQVLTPRLYLIISTRAQRRISCREEPKLIWKPATIAS